MEITKVTDTTFILNLNGRDILYTAERILLQKAGLEEEISKQTKLLQDRLTKLEGIIEAARLAGITI